MKAIFFHNTKDLEIILSVETRGKKYLVKTTFINNLSKKSSKSVLSSPLYDLNSSIKRFYKEKERICNSGFWVFKETFSLVKVKNGVKTLKPSKNDKNNYFGIEVEFLSQFTPKAVKYKLKELGLDNFITLKTDASIDTHYLGFPKRIPERQLVEGYYGHEICILVKTDELNKIKLLKKFFHEIGAVLNKSCGLHIHVDARNTNHKELFLKLFNLQPLLFSLNPERRYCLYSRKTKIKDFDLFIKMIDQKNKHFAINPFSYKKYKTIEVRCFSPSIDPSRIIFMAKALNKGIIYDGLK